MQVSYFGCSLQEWSPGFELVIRMESCTALFFTGTLQRMQRREMQSDTELNILIMPHLQFAYV